MGYSVKSNGTSNTPDSYEWRKCFPEYGGAVVAFDLDDTLASEANFVLSAFSSLKDFMLRNYPDIPAAADVAEIMRESLYRRENYYTAADMFLSATSTSLGIPRSHFISEKEIVDFCRNSIPREDIYTLRPGVAETLSSLSNAGVPLALITDGRSSTQRNKIKALHLDDLIPDDSIYISQETGHDKSSPRSFSDLMRRFPQASRFLYIADNLLKDFYHPNILGWTTLLSPPVDFPIHISSGSANPQYAPQHTLSNFSDLLQYSIL